ncbi:MAG: hypothetical protein PHE55_05155 [Methylococcaceae bacterium]|nr:hypothetical protein [Methylococcaceae bacterium]
MGTLLASAARTASGTQVLTGDMTLLDAAAFLLSVTAAATEVDDTLDVYLQHSPDGGTNYDDFVHFTQVLGNGGAKKLIAEWSGEQAVESELHALADATLAAGVLQGPKSGTWRLKWVIADAGGGAASFTFSVSMSGRRRRR